MGYQRVICSNDKCRKMLGEIAHGKGRYVCPRCKAITVVEVTPQPEPQDKAYQDRMNLNKK